MSKILGIDLGTTNSVVSVYDNGRAVILPPSANQRTTPSIVAFDEDGRHVVGEQARNLQVTNPSNTVYSIKRFMGRRHHEVSSEEKLVPYEVVGRPDEYVRVRIGRKKYMPQEISAMLLAELRRMAEAQLGEPVSRAIITVPAYFNDSQRQATKDSGEIAGLTVERIINEPTAAALAYGIERRGNRCIVVFDFGGGTFDLSAMRIGDGMFKVLAVHGNSHLGGDDFDQRIIDVLAEDFQRKQRIDLRKDPMALQRLKQAAQQAKADLSIRTETNIMLPFIAIDGGGPKHLEFTLTRDTFESVSADLFDEVGKACRQLMAEAGISASQVADIVMVGGSTRIPKVQQVAREVFNTGELDRSINPDEVVALGAATLGGVLQGDLHNVHLMDVTSHSFGVETANGGIMKLVPKDTPIPVKVRKIFSTPRDNQTSVPINVLEGEGDKAQENRELGVFRLTGIRKAPRGVPKIEVEFSIDANGILHVAATDKDTGRTQQIVVTGSCGIEDDEKERMKRDAEESEKQQTVKIEQVEIRNHAEGVAENVRQWLKYNAELIPNRAIEQIESTLLKLDRRIAKNDQKGMRTLLKKLESVVVPYRKAG